MSIEVPSALRVARPNPHRIVAKYNSLLRYVDLRQYAPGGEEMLLRSRNLVMIAFDKMDRLTGQALTIGNHLFRSPQAKVPKEIENVVRLHARIHAVCDCIVHDLYFRKRAIAVPNDIEVPKVEVGREPDVTHTPSFSLI